MVEKDNLLIVGAGGYGKLAREIAVATGDFDKIAFLDDVSKEAIGKIEEASRFAREYGYAFVAIGNAKIRRELLSRLKNCGYRIAILIHPQSYVSPSANIGEGCCVEPFAVVHTGAMIGEGCLICAGAVVNHEANLGVGCHVDCNATIPARAYVPPDTKIEHATVFKTQIHK